MRILIVHNRYLQRGGEDECFEEERDLLRQKGHAVEEHVVENSSAHRLSSVRTGLTAIWNRAEYRCIRSLIRSSESEIVHVHNSFPIVSPAVYYAAERERVPVIQTLHNYRLLCPAALFYRDGGTCEDCLGKVFAWPAVFHKCYRGNRSASGAVAAMLSVHKAAKTWSRVVTAYIALTEFARRRFIEGHLPAAKIHVKPNFVQDTGEGDGRGGYALFVGRLSEEKGIRVLLSAWCTRTMPFPLKIIGAGPLEPLVRNAAAANTQIEFLGQRTRSDVQRALEDAVALVCPSICYEGFPRTIAEAFCAGTPVIASCTGAMESLVTHGDTGLHFRVGDAADLATQVHWIAAHEGERLAMRRNARDEYLRNYTPERNYDMLMQLYAQVAATRKAVPTKAR